jgi:hypothetical protein
LKQLLSQLLSVYAQENEKGRQQITTASFRFLNRMTVTGLYQGFHHIQANKEEV